ncbi:branched chain amino acid aminotransferase [Idiomarina tyrosinivorans]|uniref:Branched-chain-amino-acid aminotransferase n=1 Tax=Idiomarina tyrosinivorans TaxID=1445662 RepID=A0A432ZSG0_9GAMM|nr:branched-chain amino acid aminotransferase [Idiomarina tyrosinivorans]RUO80854.1 branched chain amino acid aminotransferase [Idiomarina tyrosinivorans]
MAAFGKTFMPKMTLAKYENGQWQEFNLTSAEQLTLHPGAHVLHYASTCFEGLKAFRHRDGSVHIFRLENNVARMQQSARLLNLPEINAEQLRAMIIRVVEEYVTEVPEPPGSMYIRPTLIGTEAAIGKAAAPTDSAMLYVLLSPVGDYFAGGERALRLLVEEDGMRCAAHMGMIKSGGNYASAMPHILAAKAGHQADQVLFAPNGDVQETGAANFLLLDGDELITKNLDSTFLHGITRDSLLTLAADMGYRVSERELTVSELLERAAHEDCEAALSGTAAVLAPVGELLHNGTLHKVGSGNIGTKVKQLRQALNAIQWGQAADKYGWLTRVSQR